MPEEAVKPADVTKRVGVEVIRARGVDVDKLIKMLVANAAASPVGPRATTISPGAVPSTTQMHLSPDARPARRKGIRTWSRSSSPENTPQM